MPVFRLSRALAFPDPALAEDGLLAIGGDLSVQRLLLAYRSGIFPWYSAGEPLLWWAPDPRLVLYPEELHTARRLERTLRQGQFCFSLDQAFPEVIHACAAAVRPGQDGTWITPEMQRAYIALHQAGYAHSAECWRGGRLVGGLYGVSLGAAFFGESMFARESGASKAAFVVCIRQLHAWGCRLVDCQVTTQHLLRFGAREIPRNRFLRELSACLEAPTRRGPWRLESPSPGAC